MPKTTCSKCGKPLEETRVFKQRYCCACHAKHMREHRPKHRDLPEPARRKANARSYLHEYVKRRKVSKLPCKICGSIKSEAHHRDYSKPLEVIWLCRKHHLELHKGRKYIKMVKSSSLRAKAS